MAHVLQSEFTSLDDYLAGERDVDIRSEYIDGHIYVMAGASERIPHTCAYFVGVIIGKLNLSMLMMLLILSQLTRKYR